MISCNCILSCKKVIKKSDVGDLFETFGQREGLSSNS